jgi:hypothetical protein
MYNMTSYHPEICKSTKNRKALNKRNNTLHYKIVMQLLELKPGPFPTSRIMYKILKLIMTHLHHKHSEIK